MNRSLRGCLECRCRDFRKDPRFQLVLSPRLSAYLFRRPERQRGAIRGRDYWITNLTAYKAGTEDPAPDEVLTQPLSLLKTERERQARTSSPRPS